MKKTYMKPESTVNKILLRNTILEYSNGMPTVLIDPEGSVDAVNVESRRGSSIWDDDEE